MMIFHRFFENPYLMHIVIYVKSGITFCITVGKLYIYDCHDDLILVAWPLLGSTWAPSQYKRRFSRYGNFHYEEKTVVRPSYLYNGNRYAGKMMLLYQNGPLVCLQMYIYIAC